MLQPVVTPTRDLLENLASAAFQVGDETLGSILSVAVRTLDARPPPRPIKRNNNCLTSSLIMRNITVNGRRTSARLEQIFWDTLYHFACTDGVSINSIFEQVAPAGEGTLASAVRVYLVKRLITAAYGSPSLPSL